MLTEFFVLLFRFCLGRSSSTGGNVSGLGPKTERSIRFVSFFRFLLFASDLPSLELISSPFPFPLFHLPQDEPHGTFPVSSLTRSVRPFRTRFSLFCDENQALTPRSTNAFLSPFFFFFSSFLPTELPSRFTTDLPSSLWRTERRNSGRWLDEDSVSLSRLVFSPFTFFLGRVEGGVVDERREGADQVPLFASDQTTRTLGTRRRTTTSIGMLCAGGTSGASTGRRSGKGLSMELMVSLRSQLLFYESRSW